MTAEREKQRDSDWVSPTGTALLPDVPWMVVLYLASFWRLSRTMGRSPRVWLDNLLEEVFITDCLGRNQCSTVGPGATVGIFHSAGYLHWRSLLEWLGIGAEGTYHLIHAVTALGVVVVALAARRLDGRVAGGLAALIMAWFIGIPNQLHIVTDVSTLPFLGAAFFFVAVAAAARPGTAITVAMGLVGAVAAVTYATGLLCGVSAVWVALLERKGRWRRAAIAAASFSIATFLISPGSWVTDAQLLLSHQVAGNGHNGTPNPVWYIPEVRLTAIAVGAWVVAAAVWPALRRRLDVPAAVILPVYVPMLLGSRLGVLDPKDKYLSTAMGAVGAGVAITCVAVARPVLRWLANREAPAMLRFPLERIGPYAAAAVMFLGSMDAHAFPGFDARDLEWVEQQLVHHRGWTWSKVARNLKTPEESARQGLMHTGSGHVEPDRSDTLENAYLLRVPQRAVRPPLPSGMLVQDPKAEEATLLSLSCSWIDWRSFTVCSRTDGEASGTCTPSGLPGARRTEWQYGDGVPGISASDRLNPVRRRLTIHFPLHPRDTCPEDWIYFPRMRNVCPGRFVSAAGVTAEVSQAGRWARLKRSPSKESSTPELIVEWEIGRTDCDNLGYPPFFLEGEPESINTLADVLEADVRMNNDVAPELSVTP